MARVVQLAPFGCELVVLPQALEVNQRALAFAEGEVLKR